MYSSYLYFIGILNTLFVSFISCTIGFIISIVITYYAFYNRRIYLLFYLVSSIILSVPLLLQLYIVYFGLPYLFTSKIIISPYTCAILALGVNVVCRYFLFLYEGIININNNQILAAYSLGFNNYKTYTSIILPQVLIKNYYPCFNIFISLIKDSSLLSAISIMEVTKVSMKLLSETMEIYHIFIPAFIYWCIISLILLIIRIRHKKDDTMIKYLITLLLVISTILISTYNVDAKVLEKIVNSGIIVVGTEARFLPFEYIKDNKIIGYNVDLLKLVLTEMSNRHNTIITVVYVDVPFQNLLLGLNLNKYDYIVSGITESEIRRRKYHLSYPIMDATVAMLVKKNSNYKDIDDLSGKIIGTQTGSTLLHDISDLNNYFLSKSKKTVSIVEYTNFDEAYEDLLTGRIDGVAQALANLQFLCKQKPNDYKILLPAFGKYKNFCWLGKKHKDNYSLNKEIDDILHELNNSGKIKKLQKKWFD